MLTGMGDREIIVELERNRVRVLVKHGEDEEVIKLTLNESEILSKQLAAVLEDYRKRKHVRID